MIWRLWHDAISEVQRKARSGAYSPDGLTLTLSCPVTGPIFGLDMQKQEGEVDER